MQFRLCGNKRNVHCINVLLADNKTDLSDILISKIAQILWQLFLSEFT